MPDMILELKHSIRTHMMMLGGPSPQLSVFLLKVVDFLEDADETRRNSEMANLAFAIVEAVALHVQQSVDAKSKKDSELPKHISSKSDGLLVIIGKSRGLPDKIQAKEAVLKEVAEVLRSLSTYTKGKYPEITTASGVVL